MVRTAAASTVVGMEDVFLEAVAAGDLMTVRRLLDQHPVLASARGDDGVPAVRVALSHGHQGVADEIVAAGPDLDVFDAAAVGRERVVRIALDLEPLLVESWSTDGFQPLHLAAAFGHLGCVRTLLAAGAPVDEPARNLLGGRPLHAVAAATSDPATRLAIAEELLDAGADPGARQAGGVTPLHVAAHQGDEALARLLLERGADAGACTDAGRSTADVAVAAGHLALGALLTMP